MNQQIQKLLLLLALLLGCRVAMARSVYQWRVDIPSVVSDETHAHPQAFLWVPENCRRVKAVVAWQQGMSGKWQSARPVEQSFFIR